MTACAGQEAPDRVVLVVAQTSEEVSSTARGFTSGTVKARRVARRSIADHSATWSPASLGLQLQSLLMIGLLNTCLHVPPTMRA